MHVNSISINSAKSCGKHYNVNNRININKVLHEKYNLDNDEIKYLKNKLANKRQELLNEKKQMQELNKQIMILREKNPLSSFGKYGKMMFLYFNKIYVLIKFIQGSAVNFYADDNKNIVYV